MRSWKRDKATPFETDVLEVWFAGAHADVGGGAVANTERHKLAQIPLALDDSRSVQMQHWYHIQDNRSRRIWSRCAHPLASLSELKCSRIVRQEILYPPLSWTSTTMASLPDQFVAAKLVPIDKHDRGEQLYHLKSHTDIDWTPEQLEDCFDAISPMNDQLVQAPNWWILEFFPVEYKVPTTPGNYIVVNGMNLGRYRAVEDAEPRVHWTVLYRSQHLGYKIQARTAVDSTWQPTV